MAESSQSPKKPKRYFLWLLLPLLLVFSWLIADALYFLGTPANSRSVELALEIPPGTSAPNLSELLYAHGLVSSARKFSLLIRLRGVSRQIKAGEYQLSTNLRPGELLDKLVRGEVLLRQITFPEGYTLKQMAHLLQIRDLARADQFIAAANDPTFILSLGIPTTSLEGYLFPDTYRFARGLSVKTIIQTMVARFNQHFGQAERERARQVGLNPHEVVILASIVEKETAVASERPLIAGVFFNRLRRRILLQSDPTVIYGLENFDGNLTRLHLRTDTPYNTYTRQGLPAGPICNPGAASIQAVLNPAPTSYLYFVAKKDGTHHFSTTLADHNTAVSRHQKRP